MNQRSLASPPHLFPFTFSLRRSSRRKTAAIQVYPDGRVIVSAPAWASDAKIHEFLFQKSAWVVKVLQRMEACGPKRPPSLFQAGETFFHQGLPKKLVILEGAQNLVAADSDLIYVSISQTFARKSLQSQIQTLLEEWYRQEALRLCTARTEFYSKLMCCAPAGILIKSYRSRWGTCKSSGEITFNWRLAMAPPKCLDYVVIHELAHLKYHHHGPLFWSWVKAFYPDPRGAKKDLQLRDQRGELRL